VAAVLPVVPVGVASDGQMEMPEDPADIGWYRFGARPGSPTGSSVLAGHVDSVRFGVGPLARLSSMHEGDPVTVRTTHGPLSFRVVRVQVISKSDVALRQVFRRGGPPSLRIVTCGPPYIPSRGGYQDNVIVTARPLPVR
jgi:sortase (surface protein transpeptidase)